MSVSIIGDISIAPRTRFPAGLDVRSGGDGRNRIIVPETDRLALAQAIAGDAYRVVAVDQLWDFCDATWVDLQTGTASEFDADELARAFADKTDADLVRDWDNAAEWRDWLSCELIYAEQTRRSGPKTEADDDLSPSERPSIVQDVEPRSTR